MDNTTYTTLSAQIAIDSAMQAIANNTSNANTVGYKEDTIQFREYLSNDIESNNSMPQDFRTVTNFTQGSAQITNRDLDFMILGEGFFILRTPEGRVEYTRNGNFFRNNEGVLVTSNGNPVLSNEGDEIIFEEDDDKITVDSDGVVYADFEERGTIGIRKFNDKTQLRKISNNNFKSEINGEIPNSDEFKIRSGALEGSNVDITATKVKISEMHNYFQEVSLIQKIDKSIRDSTIKIYSDSAKNCSMAINRIVYFIIKCYHYSGILIEKRIFNMKINSEDKEKLKNRVKTAIKKLESSAKQNTKDERYDKINLICHYCERLLDLVENKHDFNNFDDLTINNISEILPILENIKILDDRALAFIECFLSFFPYEFEQKKEYNQTSQEYEKYSSLLKKYLLTELLGTNSECISYYHKIDINRPMYDPTELKRLEELLLIQSYIFDGDNKNDVISIYNRDTNNQEIPDNGKLMQFYADDIKKEIEGTEQLMKEFINLQSNEKNYEEHKKNQLSQKVKEEFRSSATKSAIVALSASGIALGSAGTAALLDEKIADKILRQLKEKIGLKSVSPQTLAICLIALGIMFLGIAGTVALATEQKRQNDGKKDIPPHTNSCIPARIKHDICNYR